MFLKVNNTKQDLNFKLCWNSTWFTQSSQRFKIHIYEDIFLRKYIASFFFKWSKFSTFKVVGSIYLLRTFGKLYIRVSFFYPNAGKYGTKMQSAVSSKNIQKASFKVQNLPGIQPLLKCKKQLLGISLFYQLERILGVQVFFKFTNICNPFPQATQNSLTGELVNFLVRKLTFFRIQFKSDLYCNTIMFFTHLFKFTKPDGLLFANYLAYVLRFVQRHTYFLVFLKKVLQIIYRVFKFRGVKILLSGKLNSLTRAQTKQIQVGSVPLQTIKIPYSKNSSESFTRAGKIGITVWIC